MRSHSGPHLRFLVAVATTFVVAAAPRPVAAQTQSGTIENPSPQATLRVDFSRALDLARTHNPEWRALQSGPRAAAGDLLQAGMTPNPVVTLRSNLELPFTLESAGIGVSQEFELGGKRAARIALAESRSRLAEFRARETERQLRLQLQNSFAEGLYLQQLAVLREELLRMAEQTLDLTRKRLELGDVAGVDVMQLETEVARRRAALQEVGGRLRATRASLTRLLGEPATVELVLEGQLGVRESLPPLDELTQLAQGRPDLQAAGVENEAAQRDIDLQRARGVSNLTASLGLTRERTLIDGDAFRPRGVVEGLDERSWVVGVSVAIPLPINDTNEGNIQRAQAVAEGTALQQEAQRQRVAVEVTQAYYEWLAARDVATTLGTAAVQRARQVIDITIQAYQLGYRTLLNVLQARQEYVDLQVQRLEALRNQELALTRLQAAIGGSLP
jgi:outer membrane protein, heavy metal efflux system